ncbi:hypothetical protein [Deferribacter abyssi]|uniref:hypothetical protein n=1 Tax=Deferribacter abyssi TaxID=213806 RepID=UPI003C1A3E52
MPAHNIRCPYCDTFFKKQLSFFEEFSEISCPNCHLPFVVKISITFKYFCNPEYINYSTTTDKTTSNTDNAPNPEPKDLGSILKKVIEKTSDTTKNENKPSKQPKSKDDTTITISPEVVKTINQYAQANNLSIYKLHQQHFQNIPRTTLYDIFKNCKGKESYVKKILAFYREITPIGQIKEANS